MRVCEIGNNTMRRLLLLLLLSLCGMCHAAVPITRTLPNRLRLLMVPSDASQLVSIELLLDASACDERFPTREEQMPWVRIPGLRKVLLAGMMQGSAAQDGVTLRRMITDVGGVLEARAQQDVLELSVTVPTDSLAIALNVLAEIVCHPQLTDAGIQAAIAQAKADLTQKPSSVLELAESLSRKTLFADHPYATAGQGNARMLQLLTPDMVRFLYPYFVRPDNAVLAIVGNCHPDEAQVLVEHAFVDWKSTRQHWFREQATVPLLAHSQVAIKEDQVQVHGVMVSYPVCGITSPDYLVLSVIDVLLGAGTGARLFLGVREEGHLAYEVSSRLTELRDANILSLYAVINSSHLEATKEALVTEAQRLQTQVVDPTELARAKAFLIGRILLNHQVNARYAYDLASATLAGQGEDDTQSFTTKVNAITADEVQRVATQYFTHYLLVIIAPNVTHQVEN